MKTGSSIFYIITFFMLFTAVGCIQVKPPQQTCECGETLQFIATVIGLQNKDVNWSIDEGDECGTITVDGLYTAPDVLPSPPTATVNASSVSNPEISGTAVVNLIGGSSDVGELGGPCYTDGTCNSDLLVCVNDICEEKDQAVVINNNIRNLIMLPQEEEIRFEDQEAIEAAACENEPDDPGFYCTVQQYKAAPEYDEQIVLDPKTEVIWEGALVDGESISEGEFTPITAKRAPLTISVGLDTIGKSSITIDEPNIANVRDGIGEILSRHNVNSSTPAFVSFEKTRVHTREQFEIALGASYKNGLVNVNGHFDFTRKDLQTKILVKFVQKYYTVDIVIPEKPSDFFAPSVNWEDLEAQITGTTSPMYVSSISYGRMALFSFESSESSTEVEAGIESAFKAWGGKVTIDVNTAMSYLSEKCTIKGTIIGGSGQDAVKAINGLEGLLEYIESGGDYSKDSPGAPLGYTLRHISNNEVAKLVLATEYPVRNCTRIANKFDVTVEDIKCLCSCDRKNLNESEEWYGQALVEPYVNDESYDSPSTLWDHNNASGDDYRLATGQSAKEDSFSAFERDTSTISILFPSDKLIDAQLEFTAWLKENDGSSGDDNYGEHKTELINLYALDPEASCPIPVWLGDESGSLTVTLDDFFDFYNRIGKRPPDYDYDITCCEEGSIEFRFTVTPSSDY